MPSKHPDTALRDILHHIDLAERFVDGIESRNQQAAFLADSDLQPSTDI
jgi:hypothetical protein